MNERIKVVMANILDLDTSTIDESTKADNTPNWDSMNHIKLMAALEEEFNVTFDFEQIQSLTSYVDIVRAIEARS